MNNMNSLNFSDCVEIKVVTWAKDSHGLFDYESRSINVKKCKIDKPCKILRKNITRVERNDKGEDEKKQDQEIQLADLNKKLNEEQQQDFLTTIIQDQTQSNLQKPSYSLLPKVNENKGQSGDNNNKPDNFLIVRSLKNKEGQQKGYVLSAGDIVKLGRIEYLVHEISNGVETKYASSATQSEFNHVYEVQEDEINQSRIDATKMDTSNGQAEGQTKTCKICLLDDVSEENFFISPCQCKGSCQYVHFLCLKTWVESKTKKKQTGNTVSYNWKKSECELCNYPLPKKIRTQQQEFELLQIDRPECPYILLESLAKDKKVSKNLFLITAIDQEDKVCLGRGHQCEVRISDISVSRQHAFIKYIDGNFVITDNNSKFGTLIKVVNPIPITNQKVAIQVGRTVITFVYKDTDTQIKEYKQKEQAQREQYQQEMQRQQEQMNSEQNLMQQQQRGYFKSASTKLNNMGNTNPNNQQKK